jgi:prevent-host-death family protein
MEHAQAIQTVTSRQFAHNASAAKRAAASGNTVFITDRGEPAFALLGIAEYRRLTKTGKSLVELLALPEAADIEFEFEPLSISAREIET